VSGDEGVVVGKSQLVARGDHDGAAGVGLGDSTRTAQVDPVAVLDLDDIECVARAGYKVDLSEAGGIASEGAVVSAAAYEAISIAGRRAV